MQEYPSDYLEEEINTAYENLAIAIVQSVAKEYRTALKQSDEKSIYLCERFFNSGYACTLCGKIEPSQLKKRILEEIRKEKVWT